MKQEKFNILEYIKVKEKTTLELIEMHNKYICVCRKKPIRITLIWFNLIKHFVFENISLLK